MDMGHMSRKARKRYRKALNEGMTQKKAYETAMQSVKPLPGFTRVQKRLRKAKAKAREQAKAIANAKKQQVLSNSNENSKSRGGTQVKLFFKPVNLNRLLTPENMVQLQEAILDVMVNTKSRIMPQFEACTPQVEWLQLVCANRSTADWVRKNVSAIRRRSKLNIELLEENELPRNIIKGCFPNSSTLSDHKVLALIATQNPIQTREWKVLYRAVSGKNLYLAVGVDDKSFDALSSFGGRISYCFGRISLILNGMDDYTSLDEDSNNDGSLQLHNKQDSSEWDINMENLVAEDYARKQYNFDGNNRDWNMSEGSSD